MPLHSLSHRFRRILTSLSVFSVLIFPAFSQAQSTDDFSLATRLESSSILTAPLKLATLLETPVQAIVQQLKPVAPPVSILINPNGVVAEQALPRTLPPSQPITLQRVQVQQTLLKEHLKDNYSVEDAMAQEVVKTAFLAGQKYNIDPLLLLAVMKVESTFNHRAVSSANAKGLMQVLPSAHPEKIAAAGGVQQLFVPHINIKMGAQILRDCLNRAGGTMAKALQFYNGAGSDPKQRYAQKVLTARQEFAKTQILAFSETR